MELWFIIALLSAFSVAGCDAVSKKLMLDNDEWITGGLMLSLASVMLAPIFLFIDFREVSEAGLKLLAVTLPLEVFAYYLFLSSIRMSALSLTLPLLAFTPALTIVTSSIILDESIGSTGLVGVLLWCRTQGVKLRTLTDVIAWVIMGFLVGPLSLKAWLEEKRR